MVVLLPERVEFVTAVSFGRDLNDFLSIPATA